MTQIHAAKGLSESAILVGRIAELESEIFKLREAHNLSEMPSPAREALLAELEKIAHLGSWVLNLETMEVKWSDALFRILGYDPEKDIASPEKYFTVLHPDYREAI